MWRRSKPRIAIVSAVVLSAIVVGCGEGDDEGDSTTTAGTATATTEAPSAESLEKFIRADFEQDDSDGNSRLDEAEADAAAKQDFADTDVNGDGVLTIADVQQEFDEARGGRADRPLSYYLPYDANGDGEIAEREYLEAIAAEIQESMDTDGNREITVEEAVAFHQEPVAGRRRDR